MCVDDIVLIDIFHIGADSSSLLANLGFEILNFFHSFLFIDLPVDD